MRIITTILLIVFLLWNTTTKEVGQPQENQEQVYIPIEQPQINAKTSSENNEKMWSYLWNNRIEIDLKDKQYISFITEKEIKGNTNIFIGIDWKTVGRLDKTSRIKTEDLKEFMYPIDSINLIWNDNYRFKVETDWKETLSINAVVWEDNNKIEEIRVF